MLIRKLVQSGPSSFTIALPREWVRLHKLSKGDLITLEVQADKIILSKKIFEKKEDEAPDITITVDGKEFRELQRDIRAAYLSAKRIILTGKTLQQKLADLKKEVSELVALEIVDESRMSLVCRNFVNMGDVSVANLIRRMDNIVRSMFHDLPSCRGHTDVAEAIRARDASINRLSFLTLKCMRSGLLDPEILADLKLSYKEIVMYWELNLQLEKIGDEIKRVARLLAKVTKKHESILHLCSTVTKNYEDVMKSFYTQDSQLSDLVALRRDQLINACDEFFEKNTTLVISEITGKLKGIMSHITDISRLVRYLVI